jgi:glycosyl transferase family 11
MIIVRLQGGIGNQLFQYAAAYALARRFGCPLAMDLSIYKQEKVRRYALDRFDIPQRVVSPPFLRTGSPMMQRALAAFGLRPFLTYREPHCHYDPQFLNLSPPVQIRGYFQSERYFAPIADELRHQLKLTVPLSDAAAHVARKIAESNVPISIHIRRGDYLISDGLRPLDIAYFRQAYSIMNGIVGQSATYFVFSDDYEYAVVNFDFLPERVIVSGDPNRAWEELILMARCHHHVIANSSFSWWGAWLNTASDKRVIAPRRWFTESVSASRYNPVDLYPTGSILI